MAIAVNTGAVDTEDRLADEKVVDMSDRIAMLDPDTSQFFTILSKLPQKVAHNPKVNWLEDQLFPNLSALAASATSAATTLDVTSGEGVYFRANDIVLIGQTGEKVRVDSISTDTLTVTRSIGDVAAATAASGGDLVILGNASAQGADTGTLKSTDRVLGFNYLQIQRNPFGFTGTDAETMLYGADDPAREIAKKGVEHKRALEYLCWAGGRQFDTSGTHPQGYMGGVTEFISTNVTTGVGTLSASSFDAELEDIFQHGSMEKVIFAAPTPAAALSRLLTDNWVRARPEDTVYGAKVNSFINGAYGRPVPVIVKRDWGVFGNSGRQLGGAIFVLDLDYIKKRPMRNRNTRLLPNRQGNGEDKVVFDYLTEMSLEFANEKAHGVLYGITG